MIFFELRRYIKEAQQGNQEKLTSLVLQFEPRISNCLRQTTPGERDDLRQELTLKLIEITFNYDTENVPTFTEFQSSLYEKKP